MSSLLTDLGIEHSIDIYGVNGETTTKMRERLPRILQKNFYTHAIILGGTNDFLDSTSEQTGDIILENLTELRKMALKSGIKKVFVVTLPELESEHTFLKLKKDKDCVNSTLKERFPDTTIDLASELPPMSLSPEERDEYWDDSVHLTPKGYDKMGEIIFNFIKQNL